MKQEEIKKNPDQIEKDIIYSKMLKAGKRIYYLDVKKNQRNDLFIVITESKKNYAENGANVTFEKHKVFLYKEDFEKFMVGMNDVISFINRAVAEAATHASKSTDENTESPPVSNQ